MSAAQGEESVLIIVRSHAGLGNQLFQYACGRALALRRGVELRIWDGVRDLAKRPDRPMRLWEFAIAGTPATEEEVARAVGTIFENPFGFIPAVLDAPDGVYLDGLWQSEKYFADATNKIRADLAFRDGDIMERARAAVGGLRQQVMAPVVGVHVRRGDYLQASTKGLFHVLSLKWFQTAMARFPERVVFLVISDDIEWCRANMNWPRVHFADGGSDLADLAFLRACDHYIISNSTFGWWGAWLSDNTEAVVIGPGTEAWFTPALMIHGRHDTSHLLPSRWIAQPEVE